MSIKNLFHYKINDASRHINFLDDISRKPAAQNFFCLCKHGLFLFFLAHRNGCLCLAINLDSDFYGSLYRLSLLILRPWLLVQPALTAKVAPDFLCYMWRYGVQQRNECLKLPLVTSFFL